MLPPFAELEFGKWGVSPSYLIGHSVGEYVAACLAGVFSLEDGLKNTVYQVREQAGLPPISGIEAIRHYSS